jgi:hypothetical protein
MKSRWILNFVLLLVVLIVGAVVYFSPKQSQQQVQDYEVSSLRLADMNAISIEFPAQASLKFEKRDGFWYLQQPYAARADQQLVGRLMSIVAARSKQKFPADDAAKFGLDQPKLVLRLNDAVFTFGTYNTVSQEQYVAYKGSVFMLPTIYAENAQIQVTEFLDKNLFRPTEKVAGFDFGHLEQWQGTKLNVDLVDGSWKVSLPKAQAKQSEMQEWFDGFWRNIAAPRVEPDKIDKRMNYPYFDVKMQGGSKVRFYKVQESPELLIYRDDEGLLYHLPSDLGFTLLNPPVNLPDDKKSAGAK